MESKRAEILKSIAKACQNTRRNPSDVTLVAVSKKQPLEKIKRLYEEGQRIFGENYVQEFLEKKAELPADVSWHIIGPLQKNKLNKIIGQTELIHSIDSLEIASALSEKVLAAKLTKKQKILLQVNIAEESSKSGVTAEEATTLAKNIAKLTGIELCGLMSMPPFTNNAEDSRIYFRKIAQLKKELQKTIPTVRELSMGTTQDFAVAIEEGATLVRIGEAVFGARLQ